MNTRSSTNDDTEGATTEKERPCMKCAQKKQKIKELKAKLKDVEKVSGMLKEEIQQLKGVTGEDAHR